jgi:pyridoxamine 5'-phosphate oxidase
MNLAEIRREYNLAELRRADLCPDPILQFEKWFEDAAKAEVAEPNAMTLATANRAGEPSARIVLLKGVDSRGFIFFTHYQSCKGRELAENPRAALVFYWGELERQVCISGSVEKLSREESAACFRSRPIGSRLAAWSSNQSQIISNRQVLDQALTEQARLFQGKEIPMPPQWGGFLVRPEHIEFWQGRPNRLHDRFLYTKQNSGVWLIERLAP